MIKQVLEEKIKEYSIASVIDQENVLQELVQQYVLASLSRAGFFSNPGTGNPEIVETRIFPPLSRHSRSISRRVN
jgi:hypothetical protein